MQQIDQRSASLQKHKKAKTRLGSTGVHQAMHLRFCGNIASSNSMFIKNEKKNGGTKNLPKVTLSTSVQTAKAAMQQVGIIWSYKKR